MEPKSKAEIVRELIKDLASDEEDQSIMIGDVDRFADEYDAAREAREDLKDDIGAIESDIRLEVNCETDPKTGKAPAHLSNADKRTVEINKRLAGSEAYIELKKRDSAAAKDTAAIQRKIDSANRWIRHYGARMANRRAILKAIGGE